MTGDRRTWSHACDGDVEMRLKSEDFNDWDSMGRRLRVYVGKRRRGLFKGQQDPVHHVSYKRFRRRIVQRSSSSSRGPAASTPLASRRQCEPSFEFDPVCQRLELDSPPKQHQSEEPVPRGNTGETALARDVFHRVFVTPLITPLMSPHITASRANVPEQEWMWTAAVRQQAGSDDRRRDLQPFARLDNTSERLQGKPAVKLAAPSLLNDYYTNLLDCSCHGTVALALGSSVYLWNSETRALVGRLDPCEQPGRQTQTVSCLCWSSDGRALCIGTRRGDLQLWDVEQNQKMRGLPSHLSVVRALSWKQKLLSSGSVLGRIHHLDPRDPAALVGAVTQGDGICSLQWSPGGDRLASGSIEGLLRIWDCDVTGLTSSRQPITTMKQPSAVKAMGWCPWERNIIATGGGWKDGELRIWDADSGAHMTSADTNSQICSLRWAEKKRCLVTGHGLPQHQVTCWTWEDPSLSPTRQLTGHSQRVLHLASNPHSTEIFSAAADQRFHIWDI